MEKLSPADFSILALVVRHCNMRLQKTESMDLDVIASMYIASNDQVDRVNLTEQEVDRGAAYELWRLQSRQRGQPLFQVLRAPRTTVCVLYCESFLDSKSWPWAIVVFEDRAGRSGTMSFHASYMVACFEVRADVLAVIRIVYQSSAQSLSES